MSASPYVQEFRARKLRGVVLPSLCWLLVAGIAVVTGDALVDGLSDGTRSETGVVDWVLVVVPLLVALPWAWSMFDGIGRSMRLGGFDPESAAERCTLTVREYGTRRQSTLSTRVLVRGVGAPDWWAADAAAATPA